MKTRNSFNVMAIAIVTLSLAIIALPLAGCKTDDDSTSQKEVPIGNVEGIPIYGFNSATAIANIQSAYNSSSLDLSRSKLSTGIKKIYIVEGNAISLYSFDASTGVLRVASEGTPGTYVDCFRDIVLPQLALNMFDKISVRV